MVSPPFELLEGPGDACGLLGTLMPGLGNIRMEASILEEKKRVGFSSASTGKECRLCFENCNACTTTFVLRNWLL